MKDPVAIAISWMLTLAGGCLVAPAVVALACGEYRGIPLFLIPAAICWLYVWRCRRVGRRAGGRLADRNAFLFVGKTWVVIMALGAIPLFLYGFSSTDKGLVDNITDAVFESVSGFTATGATVFADVESFPKCINFWRCMMHWLGGMGIIALALAVLPKVGINTSALMKAEASGSDRGRLTVKIGDTAKVLIGIYFAMTVVELMLLRYAGLGWFDSVCHALSNTATGGFSTRNESIRAFGNPAVEWICTVFMLAGAVNYACYFMLLTGRFRKFLQNSELRAFALIVVVATGVCSFVQWGREPLADALRHCAFEVAAVISTTGFMGSDYTEWAPAAQMVIFVLCMIGGCSGSTSGGVKVVRWTVLWKQLRNDVAKLIHPHGVYTIRLDGEAGRESIVPSVSAFVFVYFMLVLLTATAAAFSGMEIKAALTSSMSMVGNIGPAFGEFGGASLGPAGCYGTVAPYVKWVFSGAMLAGRLEIYTLLILVGDITSRKAEE